MSFSTGDYFRVLCHFTGQQANPAQVHTDFQYITGTTISDDTLVQDMVDLYTSLWNGIKNQWHSGCVFQTIKVQRFILGTVNQLAEVGEGSIGLSGTNANSEGLPAQCAPYWRRKTGQPRIEKRQHLPAPTEQALVSGLWQSSALIAFTTWASSSTALNIINSREYKGKVFSRKNNAFYDTTGDVIFKATAGTIKGRAK